MKIKTGKQTAFEVTFFADSQISRGWWYFRLPTIEVARFTGRGSICFFAFFWSAGVGVKRVKNENKD